ncbi:hypothetical protein FF100_07120 [Methylobacterium terricola]|uniref:Uncharacterized protein n=1 Tax=Methylobacterium terricola TaxID=2583531 RepID=A0A5C4LMK0_9HYPH|nr:hypothetical protein [Methylobacterium terricola]TNC15313.1 hypothetical protein FF100_07120 [Methylobacterium terricola]
MTKVGGHGRPGEQLFRHGRPSSCLILSGRDVFQILFSLLWTGFFVVSYRRAWRENGDLSFRIFGIPVLLAGLTITVGRFVLDVHLRNTLAPWHRHVDAKAFGASAPVPVRACLAPSNGSVRRRGGMRPCTTSSPVDASSSTGGAYGRERGPRPAPAMHNPAGS